MFDSNTINSLALDSLENFDFAEAQKLFYKNANSNPSYQSYNNLGAYLVTEGQICKSGRVRNGVKIGLKYLLKSRDIKPTDINAFAILTAVDYLQRDKREDKKALYTFAAKVLEPFIDMDYRMRYNYFRFLFMLNPKNRQLLPEIKKLMYSFKCKNSVSLYFELLCQCGLDKINECLSIVADYRDYLDDVDILMFYSKVGLYRQGVELCEKVLDKYAISKDILSAIIECAVNTDNFDFLKRFANDLIKICEEDKDDVYSNDLRIMVKELYKEGRETSEKRKRLIDDYKCFPEIIASCYYFGCNKHGTNW